MANKRSPDFITAYRCLFCSAPIKWGVIVRMLRREPGQPAYMEIENYAHLECLRNIMRSEVPLNFAMQHESADCAVCGDMIPDQEATLMRLQRPTGTVRKPTFDEEQVKVHLTCLFSAARN
jgi:hypothetical protein